MSDLPDLIGSAEVCSMLGIDRSTLIRWIQLNKITPAMQLPGARGAFLFYRSTVEEIAQRVEAAS